MSQSTHPVYEASVYERTIKYTNFKRESAEVTLFFALDPLQLMQFMASFEPPKQKRSGNPAMRDQPAELTSEQSFTMIRDIATKSAGFPSDDGESWEPFENFENTLAGKSFLTQLASSDADRREFGETVIMAPLRAFLQFARVDETNSKADLDNLEKYVDQMDNVFKVGPAAAIAEAPKGYVKASSETAVDRRAQLQAELDAMPAT